MTLHKTLLGLGVSLILTASLQAQSSMYARPIAPPRPILNPYMNFFRVGGTPEFNYLTLVRPQVDLTNSINKLGENVGSIEGDIRDINKFDRTLTTGHRTGFMTHTKYFMTVGMGASGAGGAANRALTAGSRFSGAQGLGTQGMGGMGGMGMGGMGGMGMPGMGGMGTPGLGAGAGRRY
jgi:hypothetical protein